MVVSYFNFLCRILKLTERWYGERTMNHFRAFQCSKMKAKTNDTFASVFSILYQMEKYIRNSHITNYWKIWPRLHFLTSISLSLKFYFSRRLNNVQRCCFYFSIIGRSSCFPLSVHLAQYLTTNIIQERIT